MSEDTVTRVLQQAESLRALADLLPEENGLAGLLGLIARELKECGEILNDHLPPGVVLEMLSQ